MNRLPPSSRPVSFRLRQLVQLRSVPKRWSFSLGAAFCIAAPVAFGWSVGNVSAGLIASFGTFTALYGADRPYRNRALKLAAIAVGLACAVALGAWSQRFGLLGIVAVVLVAMGATFFCNALGVRPPGGYLFALAGALGNGLPGQELDWWHAGLLVLAGGGFSAIVRLAGVLTDSRGPERAAVASAGTAVARFLKSVGGPDEDTARHGAAVALHNTWTMLVSHQPAASSDESTLIMLRSISRELHRLFVDGINADSLFTDRNALAARAQALATEARSKAASTREEPEHLPLGRHGLAESLQESLVWPSPVLIVSLRVGLAAALAGMAGAALDLERAYWIVAATVLVLHQGLDWNRSTQRGLERVIGTLVGLALAGAVLWLAPQGLWLALTLAALQFLILMLVGRNYALAVVFITAAADHNGRWRTPRRKYRGAALGSCNRYGHRLYDRNWRLAGDGPSRGGRSDPARTRRSSAFRSRAAEIRCCRRRGFHRSQTGPAKSATQGDRAPDGIRDRSRGVATPPFRRGIMARRRCRTTLSLSIARILLGVGRGRQRRGR